MQLFLLILVNVIVLMAGDVAADVYKCPDGKGGTVLVDAPCSVAAEQIKQKIEEQKQQTDAQYLEKRVDRIRQYVLPADYQQRVDICTPGPPTCIN